MALPRAAGKIPVENHLDEGTHYCLNVENRPPTPPNIQRLRKSYYAEPGMIVNHHGLIEDCKKLDRMYRHGVTTHDSEHVDVAFQKLDAYAEQRLEKRESIYESRRREPLGKPYSRGHVLPAQTKEPKFSFGVTSRSSESAKNLIYPLPTVDESAFTDQYIRSHGSWRPGEQKDRKYAWGSTGIDPNRHKFGKLAPELEYNGVGLVLNPGMDDAVPKTRLGSQPVEQMKNTKDQLGRCRNLGLGAKPEKRVFGVKGAMDEWGAAECLAGRYSAEEQMPDPDLGRAVKAGWCNVTTDKRSFGCPSVRSDIKKPARRSVSDSQNYGDDVSAHTLVQPPQYGHLGVEDEAFFEPLSKQEIREMFAAIGYVLADGDFAEVWRSACGDSTRCSVQGFQMSLNEHLDNARA
jgi:hypothetical protein